MGDAIVVGSGDKRCQRDDVFRVIVLDGMEIAKLAVIGIIVGNDVTCLNVGALSIWLCTYEIYLACLQLPYVNFVAEANEMVVDNILYDLLNVPLASTTCKCVTNAMVFEVLFVIPLKQTLAVNVIKVHLV